MTSIIEKWLLNSIGIKISTNTAELGDSFNDGRNFAKILSAYGVCHPKYTQNIVKTDTTCGAYLNLKKLCVWLKVLEIPYTEDLLKDIANKKSHAALKLLYELFIKLEGRENVKEINAGEMNINQAVAKSDEIDSSYGENNKESKMNKTPLQKERNMLQLNLLECRARRKFISKMLIKRGNTCMQKTAKKIPLKFPEELDVYEEIDNFEKRLYDKQMEAEEGTEELADLNRLLEFKPKTLISLSKIKHRQIDAEKLLEYHLNKHTLDETWRQTIMSKETEARDELAKKLYLQSEYEKEKCMNIKSSLLRYRKFMRRKEQKKIEENRRQVDMKNDEEPTRISNEEIVKLPTDQNANLTKILHEIMCAQNIKRRKNITYTACQDMADEIIDMAIVQGDYVKEKKTKPSKEILQQWKSMFCHGDKLINISCEDVIPDVPECKAVVEARTHSDYYNYMTLQGSWDPEQFSEITRKSEHLNVVGYIVHRIIDLRNKHRTPFPGIASPHKYRCLLQINIPPNLIEKMQKILLRSKIIVFDANQATTYALIAYKIFFSGDGKEERKENVIHEQPRKRSAKEEELHQEKGVQAPDELDTKNVLSQPPDIIPIAEVVLMLNRRELELPRILTCFIIIECIKSLRGFTGWVLINFPQDSLLLATLEYLHSGMEVPVLSFHSELSEKWNILKERLNMIRSKLNRLSHCYLARNMNTNSLPPEKFKTSKAAKILEALYVLMVKPLQMKGGNTSSKLLTKNSKRSETDLSILEKVPILPRPLSIEATKSFQSIFSQVVNVPDNIVIDSEDVSDESDVGDDTSEESDPGVLDDFVFADDDFPWKDILRTRTLSVKNILKEILKEGPELKVSYEDEVNNAKNTEGEIEPECMKETKNEEGNEMDNFYNTIGLLNEFPVNKFRKRHLVPIIEFILGHKETKETMYLEEAEDLGGYNVLIKKSNQFQTEKENILTQKTSLSKPELETPKLTEITGKPEHGNIICKSHIYPGHRLWRYSASVIPWKHSKELAAFWERRELTYASNLSKIFRNLRDTEIEMVKYVDIILEESTHCTEYSNRLNELVSKFQDMLNSISEETRSSTHVKRRLNCSIFELQCSLWKMSDSRKIELEEFLCGLNDKFDNKIYSYFINHFSIIQEELDRFIDTIQLITDYYCICLRTFPSRKKLKKLFLPEVMWIKKPKASHSGIEWLKRFNSDILENIKQLQKGSLSENIFYQMDFNKGNTLQVMDVIELLNLFTNMSNNLKCKINEIKCKCSRENKGTLNEILSENNLSNFKWVKQIMIEWDFAIDEEIDRLLFRLDLIYERCKNSMINHISKRNTALEIFSSKVAEKYQTEITNIDQLCDFLRVIIAEEMIVSKRISLDMFSADQMENNQAVPVKKENRIPVGHQFTLQQIKNLFGKMSYAAPLGILKKYFIYILEDMALMGHELGHPYLPPIWSCLPSEAMAHLVDECFGRRSVISWKEFIVFALGLRYPTLEEIILTKAQLKEVDTGGCELITFNEFQILSLWFDEESTAKSQNRMRMLEMKKILFQMFQTEGLMNFRCFLLTFCRDENPLEGFVKALAVVNDDITDEWVQSMIREAEQIENWKELLMIPEGEILEELEEMEEYILPLDLDTGCDTEEGKSGSFEQLLEGNESPDEEECAGDESPSLISKGYKTSSTESAMKKCQCGSAQKVPSKTVVQNEDSQNWKPPSSMADSVNKSDEDVERLSVKNSESISNECSEKKQVPYLVAESIARKILESEVHFDTILSLFVFNLYYYAFSPKQIGEELQLVENVKKVFSEKGNGYRIQVHKLFDDAIIKEAMISNKFFKAVNLNTYFNSL